MKCPHCNGKGEIDKPYKYIVDEKTNLHLLTKMCKKCLGAGELDWIENIIGKKRLLPITDNFYGYADIISHKSTIIVS